MGVKKTNIEKELQGTLKTERTKISKMAPLSRIPKPSFELTPEAQKIFRNTVKVMMEENVPTVLDIFALTNFAFFYGEFIDATIKLQGAGAVQVYKSGATAISGHLTAVSKLDSILQQYMKVLGLTPKHRELIAAFNDVESEKEHDPLMALFEEINTN